MKPMTLSLTVLLGLLGAAAHAQEPVAGQPYAIPQGYEGYSSGSVITYGAYNYVIQDNGTMLLTAYQDNSGSDNGTSADDCVPIDTTAYQIPSGYEDAQPGSQISYGGNDYTIMSGGTMMMTNPGCSIIDSTQYQIPPDYAGSDVGSIITYGGFNYLVGAGVMVKININAGYSPKTIPGTPGSKLSPSGTNSSKQSHVQPQHWANQGQPQQHWPSHVQPQHWANHVQPQHWTNQGQPQHWANQGQPQQHWPSHVQPQHWANHVQPQHWTNQGQPQQHWPSHVQPQHTINPSYSRGYSGGHVMRRR